MEHVLYLECASGISGDMVAAALLDLGADEERVKAAIDSLPLKGFSVEISRVKKSGLDVCDFLVKLETALENHDHDMTYLYGRNVKSEETRDPMTYVRSLTKQTKKIKRIILFFEDGSFEDYEKE